MDSSGGSSQLRSKHSVHTVITSPPEPAYEYCYDNVEGDLILKQHDELISSRTGHRYQVLRLAGKGTFGQVVECFSSTLGARVAVKIIKSDPAHFSHGGLEVQVLRTLHNRSKTKQEIHESTADATVSPHDTIVALHDHFEYHGHLCIAFEMLGSSLYDVIVQRKFIGLPLLAIQQVLRRVLIALDSMTEAGMVHADVKPENIMFKGPILGGKCGGIDVTSLNCKLIDFGSAFREGTTAYPYIQSRYYRAPEVLLGCYYDSGVDIWSLGCVTAEMFLGLPLFPGCDTHDQLYRIVSVLGNPPQWVLDAGRETRHFFRQHRVHDSSFSDGAAFSYAIRSHEEYIKYIQGLDYGGNPQAKAAARAVVALRQHGRYRCFDYLHFGSLIDLVLKYDRRHGFTPERLSERINHGLHGQTHSNEQAESAEPSSSPETKRLSCGDPSVVENIQHKHEWRARLLLIDLLQKMLHPDPRQRVSAKQALQHPFLEVRSCDLEGILESIHRGSVYNCTCSLDHHGPFDVPSNLRREGLTSHIDWHAPADQQHTRRTWETYVRNVGRQSPVKFMTRLQPSPTTQTALRRSVASFRGPGSTSGRMSSLDPRTEPFTPSTIKKTSSMYASDGDSIPKDHRGGASPLQNLPATRNNSQRVSTTSDPARSSRPGLLGAGAPPQWHRFMANTSSAYAGSYKDTSEQPVLSAGMEFSGMAAANEVAESQQSGSKHRPLGNRLRADAPFRLSTETHARPSIGSSSIPNVLSPDSQSYRSFARLSLGEMQSPRYPKEDDSSVRPLDANEDNPGS
eukprot:gb/GECG01003996.1/.p1 GENE.gb/GECG01003996.1/~~gb/GECG01003996.1/.p1  ORF type:complete len:794 (+),score=58.12 gb/GECG01003996.1/:1-2382(+)